MIIHFNSFFTRTFRFYFCSISFKLFGGLHVLSGVANVDNWRGEYSYIRVHRPLNNQFQKKLIVQKTIYEHSPPQLSTLATTLMFLESN